MYLPKDPDMLFSMLNMKLRDAYDSFDELCDSEDIDPASVMVMLNAAGYEYDEEHNCFQYAEVLAAATTQDADQTTADGEEDSDNNPQKTTLTHD